MAEVKDEFGTLSAFTITVASLTNGSGRQSTLIDNSTNKHCCIEVSISIKLGTSPVANSNIGIYAIRSNKDTTAIRDDGAGASDAAWTRKNARSLIDAGTRQPAVLNTGSAPATGDVLTGVFLLVHPGSEWGIGIVNGSGVTFDTTGTNHVLKWRSINPLLP